MPNPTLLLATFDETLALTDTSGAGTFTGIDPVRYDDIGSADGIWVEEATTNLITNPTAGTNTTGWATFTNRTLSRVTSLPAAMPAPLAATVTTGFSVTADADLLSAPTLMQFGATLSAAAHVFSIYLYIPAAYTGGQILIEFQSFTSGSGTAQANADMGIVDDWQRVDVGPFTPNAGDVLGNLRIVSASLFTGNVVYIAATQCEQNAYATSYADGSLGDGYAWTGTAHASTSTRAASSASVDPTARIDASAGAIAFRYKRLIDTAGEEIILQCGNAGAGEDYLEIGVDSSDDLYMEWNSDNAGAERVTIATTIATDTDYFFYFDWDGTDIRASIDNGSLSSDTRNAVEGDLTGGNLTLSAPTGSHVVGPFAVFDRPLVAQEITNIDEMETWRFDMLTGTGVNVLMPRMNVRNNTLLRR